jgi:hypothetical protein
LSQTLTPQPQSSPNDIQTRVWFEHGHIVRENYQPTRNAVLEATKYRRDHPGIMKDAPFGRAMLTIPQLDYQRLIKAYPALNSLDTVEQTKAWKRFLRSPESEAYRNYG